MLCAIWPPPIRRLGATPPRPGVSHVISREGVDGLGVGPLRARTPRHHAISGEGVAGPPRGLAPPPTAAYADRPIRFVEGDVSVAITLADVRRGSPPGALAEADLVAEAGWRDAGPVP